MDMDEAPDGAVVVEDVGMMECRGKEDCEE